MSETFKIVLTSSLTIIGGVVVYTLSQIMSKFLIDPIHEQKRVIGEIADALIYYANIYANPGIGPREELDKASDKLRQLSTLLQSKTHMITWYRLFQKIKVVHKSSSIEGASKELIALSNLIHVRPGQETGITANIGILNVERADKIKKLLKLKIS